MLASAAVLAMALADGSPAAEKPFTLDESEVRITYGELKRLIAAQEKAAPPHPPPKPPPVPVALAATSCVADLTPGKESLAVEFQFENLTGAWELVPLVRAGTGAAICEPPEARFVTQEGQICAVTENAGRGNAKLVFPLRGQEPLGLAFLPCAVLALEIKNAGDGRSLLLRREGGEAILAREGIVPLPADGGEIRFSLEDGSTPPPQGTETLAITDDAIMSSAEYATIVAPDGALLTEGVIKVRLDQPAALPLVLPDGARLLSCRVAGRPLRPALKEKRLDIPLQSSREGAEVEVCISYTEARPALAAAEGEIEIALPQSGWFAREVLWSVKFPPGLQTTHQGNVEPAAQSAPVSPDTLHLKKSLCRDDRPSARITYRRQSPSSSDNRQTR
jgi:hypothetical protein